MPMYKMMKYVSMCQSLMNLMTSALLFKLFLLPAGSFIKSFCLMGYIYGLSNLRLDMIMKRFIYDFTYQT